MSRTLEQEVQFALIKVLTTKRWNGPPFTREFKQDAPGLWEDAARATIKAIDEWRAADAKRRNADPFECPINHEGCTSFCGSYGCGG